MKKTILAIAAAVMMSATVVAQDDKQQSVRRNRGPVDQTEMIQKRTDETVKAYGLNEEQAAKLLELNKQYAGKMRPGFGRQGGPRERFARPDSMRGERPMNRERMRNSDQRPARPEGNRGGFEEMRKTMEAYDAEIQKIMTEEQFKAYKADREKQMKNGPRRQGRPNRENDSK